jgi:copper chaperone
MLTLDITGMTCGGCARAVERVIRNADAQAGVAVDAASGRAEVNSTLPAETLIRAIEAAGYGARIAATPE